MYNETKQPHRWSWFRDHDSVTLPLGCCSILIWCNYGFTLVQNANILFTDGALARLIWAKQGKCDALGTHIYSFEIYQRWINFLLFPPTPKEAVIHASGTVCTQVYICSVFDMYIFVTLSLYILKLRLGSRKKEDSSSFKDYEFECYLMLESRLYFLSVTFLVYYIALKKTALKWFLSRYHFLSYVVSKIAGVGGKIKRNRRHRTRNKNLCTLVIEEIFFLICGKRGRSDPKKGELGVFFCAKLRTYVNCVHLF